MDLETCRSLAGHLSHRGGGGCQNGCGYVMLVAVVGEYFKFVV